MSRTSSRFINEGWTKEVPSGTVNNSNTVFTLAFTPDSSNSVDVLVDFIPCAPTTHYTISGATITFVTAPALGQKVFVSYQKSV